MAWDQLKSVEQIERERLDRWWLSEFHWAGLAKDPLPGWVKTSKGLQPGRPNGAKAVAATIQDHWRRGAGSGREHDPRSDAEIDAQLLADGELIDDGTGRLWHACHLPRSLEGGETTGKDAWTDEMWRPVDEMVQRRLEASGPTETDHVAEAVGVEYRAPLQGVVLKSFPRIIGATVYPMLHQAYFFRHIDLSAAHFGADSLFSSVTFLAGVSFQETVFEGRVWFDTVMVRNHARFDEAVFKDLAHFDSAVFLDYARFDAAAFQANANFNSASFRGYCRFDGAVFYTQAPTFQRANFLVAATFDGTDFRTGADFDESTFDEFAIFSGEIGGRISFRGAAFGGRFRFTANLGAAEANGDRAFYGARFSDIAEFPGAGCRFVAAFDNASFDNGLILGESPAGRRRSERAAEAEFETEIVPKTLRHAKGMVDLELAIRNPRPTAGFFRQLAWDRHQRRLRADAVNERLASLEGGYRTLKTAMGKARDEAREQRYYRFQLRVRRLRSDTGEGEKLLAVLYGLLSNYGSSVTRPLAFLLASTVVFSGAYFVMLATSAHPISHWWALDLHGPKTSYYLYRAFVFSTIKTVPFAGLFGLFKDGSSLEDILKTPGATQLLFLFTSIAQTILSSLLIFLFGLAVKRQFQIK